MRLLLDTHAFLWLLDGSPRLGPRARRALDGPENTVVVSAASAWEIAIKQASGRLTGPDDLPAVLEAGAFDTLPIRVQHAVAAGWLPGHHSDPFDRVLIAQAQIEELRLVTADRQLSQYDVLVLPADA